jgi:hypothetical protein
MENSILDEEGLNISWTTEYSRTLQTDTTESAELMESISVHFLFVNTQFELCKTIVEQVPLQILDNRASLLSEEVLIQLLESVRNFGGKRYQCDQIMQFCIDIHPDKLFSYMDTEKSPFQEPTRLKVLDIPRSITFPPSLFIFHTLNSVWIVMQELIPIELKPASILKKGGSANVPKKTKRVRIASILPKHHTKTQKRIL